MTKLLRHHGDLDATPGLVDLAVNVRPGTPPTWLRDRLASVDVSRYPDQTAARDAVAARHGLTTNDVLLTAGAAEAFVLIARALAPRRAVVVHPQFTEPEHAMRAAGHEVEQVVLDEPFVLDVELVPDDADLVVLGNPTNPTSVLHPAEAIRNLVRPGRTVVVDEAFADCVPGEPESVAGEPGVVVVRSLTKTWGLAGLRVGYLLADPDTVTKLSAAQAHWPVNALALEACVACCTPAALGEAHAWATELAARRAHLVQLLSAVPGVTVVPAPRASYLLVHTPIPASWNSLRDKGFAVRRGDTFPGLGPEWIRIAVRDDRTSADFARTLTEVLQ